MFAISDAHIAEKGGNKGDLLSRGKRGDYHVGAIRKETFLE